MNFIKVLKPGMLTTVQDRGRYGFQQWGIPVAGAMDEYALRTANLLVENGQNEGCLEITLLGPRLEFQGEMLIALTGADLGAKINGRDFPLNQAFWVQKGDILDFTGVKSGCRAYLAVGGGFDIPEVMGSKSTYVRGKLGGFQGRPLQAGDEIPVADFDQSKRKLSGLKLSPEFIQQFSSQINLKVVLGPQEDGFTPEGIKTFLSSTYQVTNEADRMGYRLEGETIEHKEGPDIISDGIAMGSVQVPGHGFPIVMMADRQTTGGYTKIATVITPDLSKLAQAKPGDKITFQAISVKEAHDIYREYENKIKLLQDNLTKQKGTKVEIEQKQNVEKKKMYLKINGKEYWIEVEEL